MHNHGLGTTEFESHTTEDETQRNKEPDVPAGTHSHTRKKEKERKRKKMRTHILAVHTSIPISWGGVEVGTTQHQSAVVFLRRANFFFAARVVERRGHVRRCPRKPAPGRRGGRGEKKKGGSDHIQPERSQFCSGISSISLSPRRLVLENTHLPPASDHAPRFANVLTPSDLQLFVW